MQITLYCALVLCCVVCATSVSAGLEKRLMTDLNLYRNVKPAKIAAADTFDLTLLKEAAATDGAVCIDGTPAGYYFRPGFGDGTEKWCESSEDCYGRSKSTQKMCTNDLNTLKPLTAALGSSSTYAPTITNNGGYFSNDPSVNPQMYNWNMVYLKYCDGGSFSGNQEKADVYSGKNLYYRGIRILTAMRASLMTSKGLNSATDVVISGCSAGGLATFFHVDWWAASFGTNTKVRGMPDSGFFLNFEGPPKYSTGMQWVYKAMNSTSGVNAECVKAYKPSGQDWRCIFAQYNAEFIKTPIFPLQSEYDAWQTANDLGSTNVTDINHYGAALTYLVNQNLLNNPVHGIFLDSCHHHCGEWGNIEIDGKNQAEAFQTFYDGTGQKAYFQDQAYPCEACCHA